MSYLIESARARPEIGLLAEGRGRHRFVDRLPPFARPLLDANPVAGLGTPRLEAFRAPLGTSPCRRSFRETHEEADADGAASQMKRKSVPAEGLRLSRTRKIRSPKPRKLDESGG
jgi:hypothetical protein